MPSGDYHKNKGKCITWLRAHFNYEGEGCLIWPFARNEDGYGQFGYNGKPMQKAHRCSK